MTCHTMRVGAREMERRLTENGLLGHARRAAATQTAVGRDAL